MISHASGGQAQDLTALLGSLQGRLCARGETVATAESCTGGMLATLLTQLPGSSAFFLGGVAAYANAVKSVLLGVDADLIARAGAVSREVAESMARGVRGRLGATWALSTTGIAGPDGGTAAKPVGTVWCALAGPDGVRSEVFVIEATLGREAIRREAAARALRTLARAVGA